MAYINYNGSPTGGNFDFLKYNLTAENMKI